MLKHSKAPAASRTRQIMTVKCRVRTLGSQLILLTRYSKIAISIDRRHEFEHPNFSVRKSPHLTTGVTIPSHRCIPTAMTSGGSIAKWRKMILGLAMLNAVQFCRAVQGGDRFFNPQSRRLHV